MSDEHVGSDILSDDDFKELEESQEQILDLLHAKVAEHDEAKAWLNTKLGTAFRKFLAADKLRAMKSCTTATGEALAEAQIDFKVVCKMESVFGSIIIDGQEALQQLTQMHEGDSHG